MSSHEDSPAGGPKKLPVGECRVLLVDDCRIRSELLANFLAAAGTDVDLASTTESVAAQINQHSHQVILIGMDGEDPKSLLRQSVSLSPASHVVAFGLLEDDENRLGWCIEAGVVGYHLRCDSPQDLVTCLNRASAGQSTCSNRLSGSLIRQVSRVRYAHQVEQESPLTAREREVMRKLVQGCSNREIADELFIAIHTVKNHVHNILAKLGASSRLEAVTLTSNPLADSP